MALVWTQKRVLLSCHLMMPCLTESKWYNVIELEERERETSHLSPQQKAKTWGYAECDANTLRHGWCLLLPPLSPLRQQAKQSTLCNLRLFSLKQQQTLFISWMTMWNNVKIVPYTVVDRSWIQYHHLSVPICKYVSSSFCVHASFLVDPLRMCTSSEYSAGKADSTDNANYYAER